jgi:hypothetical protein
LLLDRVGGNLERKALELGALKVMEIRAARSEQPGRLPEKAGRVALCFKVPFRFRQWFKLQAVRQELTMTEFLIRASEWYVEAHGDSNAPDDNVD